MFCYWYNFSDHLYLHGETQLLDAFLAISGPGCWLIIITFKQITPHQKARLSLVGPILRHLTVNNKKKLKLQRDAQSCKNSYFNIKSFRKATKYIECLDTNHIGRHKVNNSM